MVEAVVESGNNKPNNQAPPEAYNLLNKSLEEINKLREDLRQQHEEGTGKANKLEDIVAVVRDTIDMRIDETNELLQKVGNAINNMASNLQSTTSSTIQLRLQDLERSVADLRNQIDR